MTQCKQAVADPGFPNGGGKDEAPKAPRSSAVGARIEAPRGLGCNLLQQLSKFVIYSTLHR